MNAPYMPLFVSDYLSATVHLSAAEHGAYLMLIMNYWQRQKPLQDDDRKLSAIARMAPDEWRCSRETIAEFFDVRDGQWNHSRIDEELIRLADLSNKARLAGKASGLARLSKTTTIEPPLNGRSASVEQPSKHKARQGEVRQDKKDATAKAAASSASDAAPHIQNMDLIEQKCREAAGLENDPSPGLMVIGPMVQAVEAGANLERDILPVLRAWRSRGQRPPSSWRYFIPMIVDARRPVEIGKQSQAPPDRRMTGGDRLIASLMKLQGVQPADDGKTIDH